MASVDYAILAVYFIALAVIGIVLARKAGASSEHYFLGGRSMPWWTLGASGMASNLDVAGTMAIVALIYRYGLHGFFIEFRGGVVLPIAVFTAFMGKWHRRSAVMTTAEWMVLRFGRGGQGRAARFTAAFTYIVITVAMTVFFFTAGGRFLAEFLPFTALQCTIGMAVVTFAYTLVGGLYSVVWTDVLQAGIIGSAALYLGWLGASQLSPALLGHWPGAKLNAFVPHLADPALGDYRNFAWFLAIWCGKGVLEGLGGSAGSAYMAQRYYAARSDAECQKIGMLWTILFAFRWPMVLGFALLAVKLGADPVADAERVLPIVLKSAFFPAGVRGLMLAALLAAAMSTFDSTINAGASYVVKDLFEPLYPPATQRQLVWAGYVASTGIVALGLGIALAASASVLNVWVTIVMLLFPAFLVPFALRWYWWRFNGAGFAAGVSCGFVVAAALFFGAPPGWNEVTRFLVVASCSTAASMAVTWMTNPTPRDELLQFYRRVRPFGRWPASWKAGDDGEHRGDVRRLAVALVWQVLTFLIPMGAMLRMWTPVGVAAAIWTACAFYLLAEVRNSDGGGDAPDAAARAAVVETAS